MTKVEKARQGGPRKHAGKGKGGERYERGTTKNGVAGGKHNAGQGKKKKATYWTIYKQSGQARKRASESWRVVRAGVIKEGLF